MLKHKIMVTLTAVVFMLTGAALAQEYLPVPSGAQESKKQVRKLAGSEYTLTYYKSSSSSEEIKSFYRANLPALGWKEKGFLDDLSQIEQLKDNPFLGQVLEKTLVFEKDKEIIIINFLPALRQSKEIQFTLSRGTMPEMPEGAQAEQQPFIVPELVAQPKKNVAPAYPGSSLMFLQEPQAGQRAVYATADEAQKVAGFFKEQMPGYGWALQEETPAEKLNQDCPTCPKTTGLPIETWVTKLKFTKPGAECEVVLSQIKAGNVLPQGMAATTILVNYDEKR